MTRVIIRCAGDGTRWGDYRGAEKHLVQLCGEPVLHRTVRLIREIDPDADVRLIVKDGRDARYQVPGASRVGDKPDPANGDLDKIASSRHLWSKAERTVLLWGDTWWSRDALTGVLANDGGWRVWLRTCGAGGELFAFAWPADDVDTVSDALDRALAAHHAGKLKGAGFEGQSCRGGWALYRSLCEVPWDAAGDHGHSTEVHDWTEDMDTPRDWDEWCYRYAITPNADRGLMVA